MAEIKMSANEQDVQYIKEALMGYPHWENEADVIARGLVARRIGNLEAQEVEYEKIITELHEKLAEKEAKIQELKGFNNSLVALLGEIRDLTCQAIGIKIADPKKGTTTEKK